MKLKTFTALGLAIGTTGLSVAAPTAAHAQSGPGSGGSIEQITVTAQRRTELQVDVPITVATISQGQLETARIDQLADIGKVTPGVRFDFAGSFFQPTIRGVGTAVTTAGGGSNVGIYIDGFISPNSLVSDFQLMNLKNIQVLKGPQGTLFGRNTTGGAILLQTADPSTETGAMIKASYGRYNETKLQAYATYGLSDKIAMDVEGLYKRGDGFQTNISNNQPVGEYETWSVRAGVKAEFSDSVSVLLRYQHTNQDDPTAQLTSSYRESSPSSPLLPFTITNGAPFFATPGTFTFNPNQVASGTSASEQEYFRSKSDVFQMTIKADIGFADLTSYTQHRRENVDASISLSYSAIPPQLGLPNGNRTWSQEFLLTSKPGGKLQWTAGAFYLSNQDRYFVFFDYLPPFTTTRGFEFGSNALIKTLAGFVDATYEVTPSLFVTAGVRVARDTEHDAWTTPAFGTRTDAGPADYDKINRTKATPRAVVRYKPSDNSSIYASYTKGYKAGFFDLGGGNVLPVQPESIDAFEIGAKYDSRGFSAELSAFYYDYKNLQVSLYENAAARIRNAATSEIYGLDGTVRYAFDEHFTVNVGGVWLHARYKSFPNAPVYVPCLTFPATGCAAFGLSYPVVGYNLTNVTMQRAPEFTGNIGLTYKTEVGGGELALSGNLAYTSKFFFGPSGIQFPQKAYEILSLRAAWTDPSDRFMIAVYGDNLTNNRYKSQVQYGNFGIGTNWAKPVTYGVEIGAKF